jgi:hypothetical protein
MWVPQKCTPSNLDLDSVGVHKFILLCISHQFLALMFSLSRLIFGTIIVLASSKSVSAQFEYTGSLCVGAFPNITFKSDDAWRSIDYYVSEFLAKFPVWLTTECRARSRQQACMYSIGNTIPPSSGSPYAIPLIAEGDLTFCKTKCLEYFDTASPCSSFATNLMDPESKGGLQVRTLVHIKIINKHGRYDHIMNYTHSNFALLLGRHVPTALYRLLKSRILCALTQLFFPTRSLFNLIL